MVDVIRVEKPLLPALYVDIATRSSADLVDSSLTYPAQNEILLNYLWNKGIRGRHKGCQR